MAGIRWKRRKRGDLPPHRQVAELQGHFRRRLEALQKLQSEAEAAGGVRPDLQLKVGRRLELLGAEIQAVSLGLQDVAAVLGEIQDLGKQLAERFDPPSSGGPSWK